MIEEPAKPHGNPFVALGIVLVAAFMVLLDISIVNVAIPSIQRNLHATYAQIQFVIAGYALAYGVVLITGGRLGDIVGRKRMFIAGVAGFTFASALCGASQSGLQLVLARVFQGLMASLMYPQIFSIITVAFPPQRRPLALGILGGTIGVATIAGPLVGGLIIQANVLGLDWRPIFLINVPIGVLAITAAVLWLGESRPQSAPKLDLAGVAIASIGLFLLTYPLVEGRDAGWPSWSYVMLAASILVLAAFLVFERRRESLGKDPLVVSALFRNRSFTVGMLLYIACFSDLPSLFLTLSLFLQIGLGYTALHAGLTTIPFAVGSGLASGMSIRLVPRLGRTLLIAGAGLAAVGVLGVILTIRAVGPGLNGPELIPALFVAGAGLGSLLAPSLNFVLSGTDNVHVGSASGVLTTVQQIGGAIGIAIIGVIYFGLLGANADRVSHGLLPQLRQQLEAQAVPQYISERVLSGFTTCFHDRASESDPTVAPASCQRTQSPQSPAAPVGAPGLAARLAQIKQAIGGAVGNGAREARAQDFTDSIEGSLLYNAGAFALTFLLLFWLPRPTVSGAGRDELSAHR